MSSPEDRAEGTTYELRIGGLLGPLLLATLPHAAFSLEPRHTLVLTTDDGPERTALLRLVERLVDTGVEVDSIRRTSRTEPAGGRAVPHQQRSRGSASAASLTEQTT